MGQVLVELEEDLKLFRPGLVFIKYFQKKINNELSKYSLTACFNL